MFPDFLKNRFTGPFQRIVILAFILFGSSVARADGPPVPSSMSNPFVIVMLIIMGILLLAIFLLANLLVGYAYARSKKEQEQAAGATQNKGVTAGGAAALIAGLMFLSSTVSAQDATAKQTLSAISSFGGISATAFYFMGAVVLLELTVLLVLLYQLQQLLKTDMPPRKKTAAAKAAALQKPSVSWWDRFNKFRPVEQEVNIDLGHNYDGIRELDNRLPPWWVYGFYATILFAVIYLWRFHVAHSAPLSAEEYQIAVTKAAVEKEAYLKKAANNVDESSVKYLAGASDLQAGKTIFETTCFACHGKLGEGGVGPNLTDDYWLHGGSINDVFKTIKYGVPEKGMKSWKDDYSPSQIAQVASYIKSLHGSNPPNGKAPQGTLFVEPAATGTDKTTTATLSN